MFGRHSKGTRGAGRRYDVATERGNITKVKELSGLKLLVFFMLFIQAVWKSCVDETVGCDLEGFGQAMAMYVG